LRAHARLRCGDLAGAAADGRAAFETYRAYGGGPVPLAYALAALAEAERELGNIEGARRALAQAPSDTEAGTLGLAGVRLARVRVRAQAGAPAIALAEVVRIGEQYERLGGGSPALLPWRSDAALLEKRLGRDAQALELADAEVSAAADAGLRASGRSLAVRAAVGPQADALAIATEAVRRLEAIDAPLELASALLVQGLAHATTVSHEQARQILARALGLAERTGARQLVTAARDALVRVGGRPRRGASVGVDGLTAAERAVASAAATGLSNGDIAAALHLAPGTVKNQLASVYRKLSLSSRSQLRDALDGG
jgi:ATP/maltotriose-dependent transcriptional regulator MalT